MEIGTQLALTTWVGIRKRGTIRIDGRVGWMDNHEGH